MAIRLSASPALRCGIGPRSDELAKSDSLGNMTLDKFVSVPGVNQCRRFGGLQCSEFGGRDGLRASLQWTCQGGGQRTCCAQVIDSFRFMGSTPERSLRRALTIMLTFGQHNCGGSRASTRMDWHVNRWRWRLAFTPLRAYKGSKRSGNWVEADAGFRGLLIHVKNLVRATDPLI